MDASTVHNNKKSPLVKFNAKSDEAIFLGYSEHSKAYRVFNKRTLSIEESIHIVFKETNQTLPSRDVVDDFLVGAENSRQEQEEQDEEI